MESIEESIRDLPQITKKWFLQEGRDFLDLPLSPSKHGIPLKISMFPK